MINSSHHVETPFGRVVGPSLFIVFLSLLSHTLYQTGIYFSIPLEIHNSPKIPL